VCEEVQCTTQRSLEHAQAHEELQRATHKSLEEAEADCDEDQVTNFLCYCLKLLSDSDSTRKLRHMLSRCMGEEETTITISAPLPERDVCQVNKHRHTCREFKMTTELRSYEMNGVMLDLGSDVNILSKKSQELMGKPNLVWSLIQLRLANQYKIYRIDRLEQVEVNIEGVKAKTNFEVIEIMDDLDPYPTLLGIDWAFENNAILNMRKG
jgi:hypothetical protein